ncbi:hypothetical protein [Gabonia massiliensis]|uniref:hypothetical protein n=1 Tax=Gabonia massiliensis TaxID=1686296 RepID=UPI0006D832C0|nr:hypothetical protein [Gabonia massiliensis]
MEVVNKAFDDVKEFLKSVVPPCTATIDDHYHYEVWAIKEEAKLSQENHVFFGSVIKHADSITVTFNDKLGKENSKELFSDYLLQKMQHGRICIHEMNRQLHEDLQNAVQNLTRYYNSMGWI